MGGSKKRDSADVSQKATTMFSIIFISLGVNPTSFQPKVPFKCLSHQFLDSKLSNYRCDFKHPTSRLLTYLYHSVLIMINQFDESL